MKLKYPFIVNVDIPKDCEEDISGIKNWLKHQPHLPKLNDEHILMFLHSCYFSGEKTKTTIDNFFTVRAQSPEIFSDWKYEKLKIELDLFSMIRLPQKTPEGYVVLLYRMKDTDPSKMNFNDIVKCFCAFNDLILADTGLVEGFIVLFDMLGLCLSHLARVSTCMVTVRKFMIYIQDCHPVRLKGVHVINAFSLIDKALALVKPLMQSELVQLLHIHTNLNTLNEFVPLELLPADYEPGQAPKVEDIEKNIYKKLETYKSWIENFENNNKADLKKRIGKPRNQLIGDELGGSFKSLSID